MTIEEILSHIDAEISRLTEARDLVAGTARPKVARNPRKSGLVAPKPRAQRTKRVISPEGRARIAAAQKLRWAKQKRSRKNAKMLVAAQTATRVAGMPEASKWPFP